MSESLDPEEVKEIISQVFGAITSIVNKYMVRLWAVMQREGKARSAYEYLCKALKIGEKIEDRRIIGYAGK